MILGRKSDGVVIEMTGSEVARAIDAYLVAHRIAVFGPRSISINGESCGDCTIFVDPSGFVIAEGERLP